MLYSNGWRIIAHCIRAMCTQRTNTRTRCPCVCVCALEQVLFSRLAIGVSEPTVLEAARMSETAKYGRAAMLYR